MKIEKTTYKDAKELTALTIRSKSHWNYNKEQIEEWRDELTITDKYIENNHIYKLVKENQLIGYYAYQSENKTDVKLDYFFVDPNYIGKGYGKKLIVDFLSRIKKTEFQRVTLDADPNAEEFYKKLGFRVVGKLKSSIKDRCLPVMEMTL